jgi:hypothetical protein
MFEGAPLTGKGLRHHGDLGTGRNDVRLDFRVCDQPIGEAIDACRGTARNCQEDPRMHGADGDHTCIAPKLARSY